MIIATPWERRKAERFAAALDAHREDGAADPEFSREIALGDRLHDLGSSVMDSTKMQEMAERVRLRVFEAIEREQANGRPQSLLPPGPKRPQRAKQAVLVCAVLAAAAGSYVVGASSNSMPGDVLYGFKRAKEDAEVALPRSELSRGRLHLEFARRRVAEAFTVTGNPVELGRILADADTETRAGVRELTGVTVERKDAAPLVLIEKFTDAQRGDLGALLGQVGGESSGRVRTSMRLLDAAGDRVTAVRRALDCGVGTRGVDQWGPVPRPCPALEGDKGRGVGGATPSAAPGRIPGATSAPGSTRGTGSGSSIPAAPPAAPSSGPRASGGPQAEAPAPRTSRSATGGTQLGEEPAALPSLSPSPSPGVLGPIVNGVEEVVEDLLAPLGPLG